MALTQNTTDLQSILTTVNNMPAGGSGTIVYAITEDDYITNSELEEIMGSDIVYTGEVE